MQGIPCCLSLDRKAIGIVRQDVDRGLQQDIGQIAWAIVIALHQSGYGIVESRIRVVAPGVVGQRIDPDGQHDAIGCRDLIIGCTGRKTLVHAM